LMVELGLATKTPTPTPRRRRLQHSCDPIGLGLQHMAHLLGPSVRRVARAKNRVGELLDVPAGMIEIHDPSPLQTSPGTPGVHHFFEDLVVIGCDRALPRCQNRQWEKEVAEKGHLW
jgi:hypothetical protein